jgi:hypothetical protein
MVVRPQLRVARHAGLCRGVARVLVLLALAHPPAAQPHSLDQLLRLTLEQLLQVEVVAAGGRR